MTKLELMQTGKTLYDKGLSVAKSGNLSLRLDTEHILITATGAHLGDLKEADLVKVDLATNQHEGAQKPSSELPLHALLHKNFPGKAVIHCHPPLINGYFAVYPEIKALTFETKLYLGNIPVVEQDTPAVTKPELVIEALKSGNLVVLRRHGVIAMAEDFKGALDLIETLEEAVKSAGLARLFKSDILDELDTQLKNALISGESFPMFTRPHIQAIVDLVNQDAFIQQKGKEMDLTLDLAIKLDGENAVYKFNFEKGKIIRLDSDEAAPFVISAPKDVWRMVFLGKIDPFVATTQGKMKLRGDLGKLSRWYVVFSRLFEIFKQVKINE